MDNLSKAWFWAIAMFIGIFVAVGSVYTIQWFPFNELLLIPLFVTFPFAVFYARKEKIFAS